MRSSSAWRAAGAAVLIVVTFGVSVAVRADEPQENEGGDARLPSLGRTGLVIPWEDFKTILEEIRAARPRPTPAPPPVPYALSGGDAEVMVGPGETRAVVTVRFGVEVLGQNTWAEIPLIAEGTALSRLDLDGRPASVYAKEGLHHLALRGEGRHTVALEYLADVSEARGSRSTVLRFPPTPVLGLDLSIPRAGIDVTLPGAVIRSVDRAAGRTHVRAAYARAGDAYVSWSKQVELGEKETRVFGEMRTLLSIGEGMMRGTSIASYTIHGRGVESFRVAIPDGIAVLDVSAQGMKDWAVREPAAQGAGPRVLEVRLNYTAQGGYELQIAFERELPGGDATARAAAAEDSAVGRGAAAAAPAAPAGEQVSEVTAPDLTLLDVQRDKGFVAVSAATNVEINPGEGVRNATPVDPAEVPGDLAAIAGQPVLYAFKYLEHPVAIPLRVLKHEDLAVKRTIVESARLYTYASPRGPLITAARFSVRNNRKQYLELDLPRGAQPWGAYLEGRPVKAARNAAGRVLIPLKKTAGDATGEPLPFEVELVYFQPRSAGFRGAGAFTAPALDVDALEVEWNLFLPRDRRYGAFGGNLQPDDTLNRVVYLEGDAYNLSAGADRRKVAAVARLDGDVSDDEVVDKLRSLGYIGSNERQEAGAPAAKEEASGAKKLFRRDRLENDLKDISGEEAPAPVAAAPPPLEQMNQPYSNAIGGLQAGVMGGFAHGGGGLARGVLPVRLSIPTEGLRLSFAGRLLTAGERARVTMLGWPLAWTASPAMVLLLAFVLTLALLIARAGWPGADGPGRSPSGRARHAGTAAAVAGLLLLYGSHPASRALFWTGLAAAVAVRFAAQLGIGPRLLRATTALLLALAVTAIVTGAPAAFASERSATAPRNLPDLQTTRITLTWKDFKSLVEKTYVPPPPEPEPPAEAVLRSAEYRGRLEAGVLTLDGTLALDVLKRGWVRVPLTSDGTVVSFQGPGAILNRNGSQFEILARGPASLTLRLTLAYPAAGNPGENRVQARLPPTPRTLIDLTAAPAFRDLQIEGGLAYLPSRGRVYVALPQSAFTLKYTLPFRRAQDEGAEVKLAPRVQVAAYQLLRLGDGVVGGVLVHDYTVRVSKVDHFDLDVPQEVAVFDATAPGIESWKILEGSGGRRYLRVKLLAPVEGKVRVVVQFEGAYDAKAGRLAVPRFAPDGVERESGFVAVAAEGAEIDLELKGRLLPADVSEIPADVLAYAANLVAACKYSEPPGPATVKIVEHGDAPVLTTIIETLNATAVLLENGTEATWIDLNVKNNRSQFLALKWPAGEKVDIWSLFLDGEPAKPKTTDRGATLIPLPHGEGETTTKIALVLVRKGPEPGLLRGLSPRLPGFDVPVSEALWTVYLPQGRTYSVRNGPFRPVVQTAPLWPQAPGVVFAAAADSGLVGYRESKVASESMARAQVEQEERVMQQLKSVRKGALPVHIALPAGVAALPRVTVSRMLLVGDDDNVLTLRAWPAWAAGMLAWLQPLLIGACGVLLGLTPSGLRDRRVLLKGAAIAGLAALALPGPLGAAGTLSFTAVCAAATWLAVALARRLARRAAPAPA